MKSNDASCRDARNIALSSLRGCGFFIGGRVAPQLGASVWLSAFVFASVVESRSELLAYSQLGGIFRPTYAYEAKTDSLPMQLYRSLSDSQRQKVCLRADERLLNANTQ